MIVMAVSVFTAFIAIALSQDNCYVRTTGFDYVMLCMTLSFFEEIPGNQHSALFTIQTKYAFVFCGLVFGLGFLWYQGAIKAPLIKALGD
jgi:hypothetical protein